MADENIIRDINETQDISDTIKYDEGNITTLDWRTHIRRRPGMYIGNAGDGSQAGDGIYVLLKEVIDNSIDEFAMGYGKQITVDITPEGSVTVRDFGRGIPLGSLLKAVSTMNTSGKFDSAAFKKSVGLNGVGLKAVNALSSEFECTAIRDGQKRTVSFSRGELLSESEIEEAPEEPNGTLVHFTPDNEVFRNFRFREDFVVALLKNYSFLNTGLAMIYNGTRYISRHGLLDLLTENMDKEPLYPIIHLKGDDIEVAITHVKQYGEEFYSFVNGQNTVQGGTHLAAFKESVSRTIKEYFGKNFEYSDIRSGMVAAIAVKVQDPLFESQTKVKLNSREVGEGVTMAKFVGDFIKKELDNYLHRNLDVADVILHKVQESERARKSMSGITKLAREKQKKVNLHNKKLLDCTVHLNDSKGKDDLREASSIFITEGDSAAGSITKIRDVRTQAVFSLRGKPLNSYGLTQKELYVNEEFNLLMAALNLEEGLEGLRYNKVIIATDADVDGMHIRLLLITFFLQFFPDLIKMGHVYVLQTPLFRVRSRKAQSRRKRDNDKVFYCYNDAERIAAIAHFGDDAEITRFKGLGEISPEEFRGFIGSDIRLDPVTLRKEDHVSALLEFYMGKNTMERQNFIIDNLVVEDDSEIS